MNDPRTLSESTYLDLFRLPSGWGCEPPEDEFVLCQTADTNAGKRVSHQPVEGHKDTELSVPLSTPKLSGFGARYS